MELVITSNNKKIYPSLYPNMPKNISLEKKNIIWICTSGNQISDSYHHSNITRNSYRYGMHKSAYFNIKVV